MAVCIVLATGVSALETEVRQNIFDEKLSPFLGIPKGLLPIGGIPCLTWMWEELGRRDMGSNTYLVTDARSFKAYERWAMHTGFPLRNILNTGTTGADRHASVFLEAMDLVRTRLVSSSSTNSVLILPADYIFDAGDLPNLWESADSWCCMSASHVTVSVSGHLDTMHSNSNIYEPAIIKLVGETAVKRLWEDVDSRMYAEMDVSTLSSGNQLMRMVSGLLASVKIRYVDPNSHIAAWEYMNDDLPSSTYLSKWRDFVPSQQTTVPPSIPPSSAPKIITKRAYARVGLMGNPSDGFYGKTLSLLISNFYAEVTLRPNANVVDASVTFILNPTNDAFSFGSLGVISDVGAKDGFDGAARLFMAMSKVFVDFIRKERLPLSKTGFTVAAETNIPRQVGLAGSSALATGLLRCLMSHHCLTTTQIPLPIQANLVLSAERDELGIAAGHQDRVIQAYGGCVFMDFRKELMEGRGYGEYESVDEGMVWGDLWLAYVAQPKESGKVHNNVRARWQDGDRTVLDAMSAFASFASQAKTALLAGDRHTFATLMDSNFNLRRSLYGDGVIGVANLRMIEVARSQGFAAKFSGSGNAVIGLWKGGDDAVERIRQTRRVKQILQQEGFDASETSELTPTHAVLLLPGSRGGTSGVGSKDGYCVFGHQGHVIQSYGGSAVMIEYIQKVLDGGERTRRS
ncbi:hypothetical protein SmJEL517_g01977 [Synchytrium microbalum]|uniref:GHMP kinase N-terminal domain-containing protein n=1 Tax=Synchytrium microbalum TaxID=1806994 RepID=A0A507C433_9FUNG|nr:uncharacterized protein SmJEL517_g01977 [Synchytrium microbalum]TPX35727.1 hypothetical protein SmJEL517_g01977 [Synchytrium microbalum]